MSKPGHTALYFCKTLPLGETWQKVHQIPLCHLLQLHVNLQYHKTKCLTTRKKGRERERVRKGGWKGGWKEGRKELPLRYTNIQIQPESLSQVPPPRPIMVAQKHCVNFKIFPEWKGW